MIDQALEFLGSQKIEADLALVLGSGLGPLADKISSAKRIPYSQIPGAKVSSVAGHKGELVVGELEGKKVIALSGRLHGYEGHTPNEVVYLLRALRKLGIRKFILSNASGSTHKAFPPGSLALIGDHINFTGKNPLTGAELYGAERFPDMSDLYSLKWREQVLSLSKKTKLKFPLKEAVYIGVRGPNFETPAEIRAFRTMGADIVGMSTVWEAIALKQMGAEILGISCVCNFGAGVVDQVLKHEDVLQAGRDASQDFQNLVEAIIGVSL
ncbi:MAG: purine-nucleoside phosphorylase [Deltaproteobacteria bacterium CG11_big_fil_rev_8_21_14_0_20_45_16]|nr:MAG: purine-nucleoside phosphorylase [Deltaproteobacteria bacterium CG11_big_fil_rev_8_21_14_0_20_45_16]